MSALLQLERLGAHESPWLTKLPVYISTAIPVVLWFERHGIPVTWRNVWNVEFIRAQVFAHGGKNGKFLDLIAQPMRNAFVDITQEDLAAMEKLSDDAMMRFGFLSMQVYRILGNE
jgi:hypothetical protein